MLAVHLLLALASCANGLSSWPEGTFDKQCAVELAGRADLDFSFYHEQGKPIVNMKEIQGVLGQCFAVVLPFSNATEAINVLKDIANKKFKLPWIVLELKNGMNSALEEFLTVHTKIPTYIMENGKI